MIILKISSNHVDEALILGKDDPVENFNLASLPGFCMRYAHDVVTK